MGLRSDALSNWSEVREIFEAAVELPREQRAAHLDRVCADRQALRSEVEDLLAAAEESDALEPSTTAPRAPALLQQLSAPELSGTQVGGYQLGRVLASGGMGVVFEAEQDQPRRTVALKMMRLGLFGPDAARRFRYEAEILAHLRHPGIAQVYDTGVHRVADGRSGERELPWFAMEFVERARPVTAFVREGALSFADRIRLFLRICEAVQHGHQRGVVHRDLKPDNILVDGSGNPKVIDFGVARATDCDLALTTMLTHTSHVVGTLQYMAPEQTESESARVDARTDVYALGLVLFELLADQHAYDLTGKGIHEIAELVRIAPAQRLASFDPQLAGDLQVIVDTAIDKDPERRYPSVALLAEDLRRFLRSEPIAARPPSVTYQLRLFARRNRTLVLSGVVVLIVSLAATVVSVRWALLSDEAEQAARSEKAQATHLLGMLLDESLSSLLEFEQRLGEEGENAELRRDLLRDAVDRLVELEARAGDDPAVLLPLVRAYLRLGNLEGNPTRPNLGDLDAAQRSVGRAHDLATRLASAHEDDRGVQRVLGQTFVSLASLAHAEGRQEEAVGRYRDGVRVLTDLADHDLLAVDMSLSRAYGHLANVLSSLQRIDEAQDAAEARTDLTRRAMTAAPDDPERLGNHAISAGHLGMLLMQRRSWEGALARYREAAETHRILYEEHGRETDHYFSVKLKMTQVDPLWHMGRYGEAESMMAEWIAEMTALADREPELENYVFQLGLGYVSFGNLYRERAAADSAADSALRDYTRARDHYSSGAALLDDLFDAGKLVPRYQPVRDMAHRGVRECQAALAR